MANFDEYIGSVRALPDYRLEVVMNSKAIVKFDFRTRLRAARFAALRDEEVFNSVYTDGDYLIFLRKGMKCVKITGKELLELALIDKTATAPDEQSAYLSYSW